jgi:ADP-ribose pyrophosphatase YjhB (NUDIX family)
MSPPPEESRAIVPVPESPKWTPPDRAGLPRGWFPDDVWAWMQSVVPLVHVDLLPIRLSAPDPRKVESIGLIRRSSPDPPAKWTLIGGRMLFRDSVHETVRAQLEQTLGKGVQLKGELPREPTTITQYRPGGGEGFLNDPRKHAVSLVFAIEIVGTPVAQGEAQEFRWWPRDSLPPDSEWGFGNQAVVQRCLARVETKPETGPSARDIPESTLTSYRELSARRAAYDTLLWHAPLLALTAQAFLFFIALEPGQSQLGRGIVSLLSIVVTLVSLQLLEKNRYHETLDSMLLQNLEESQGLREYNTDPDRRPGLLARYPGRHPLPPPKLRWFARRKSFNVWRAGIAAFGVAAAVIFAVNLVRPGML